MFRLDVINEANKLDAIPPDKEYLVKEILEVRRFYSGRGGRIKVRVK